MKVILLTKFWMCNIYTVAVAFCMAASCSYDYIIKLF